MVKRAPVNVRYLWLFGDISSLRVLLPVTQSCPSRQLWRTGEKDGKRALAAIQLAIRRLART